MEALLTAWLERRGATGLQFRAKLGIGPGVYTHFGAPEFRVFGGVEIFDDGARQE